MTQSQRGTGKEQEVGRGRASRGQENGVPAGGKRDVKSWSYGEYPKISSSDRGCLSGLLTSGAFALKSSADGRTRWELGTQTPFEFLAHFGDFHTRHDDEFTGEHLARLIVVGELTGYAAILAILIPAEAAVGDGLGADELEAAE